MNNLFLEHTFNLKELNSRYKQTYFSADFEGQLIIMGVNRVDGGTFEYDIFHFTNKEIEKYSILSDKPSFHHIQRINEGWLLVDSRADDEYDQNASIFDDNGSEIISFHLGDGIENLQVSETGDIWVGYFDEGVFGDTIGENGLNCFNSKGELVFNFSNFSMRKNDIPPIDDCYALNVISKDEIYCYYYSDFPLLNIKNKKEYRVYNKLQIQGSHAFAVWHDYILFGPTYTSEKVFLYSQRDKSVITYNILKGNGKNLRGFKAIGRNSIMYFIDGKDIYRIDLRLLKI